MARVPLYKAAEIEMIRRIRSGEWAPGQRLPNEFGLAADFGVSQGTMRRALMTLEGMGLLNRKPGRGTVVADAAGSRPAATGHPSAGTLCDKQGNPPGFEVFRSRASTRGATQEEGRLFNTQRLSVLERTLKSNGARVALEETVVPEALAVALPENAPVLLPDMFQALGLQAGSFDDRLSATVTSMSDSVALSTDRHTGLLILTRTAHAPDGMALARQTLRMISDRFSYTVSRPT